MADQKKESVNAPPPKVSVLGSDHHDDATTDHESAVIPGPSTVQQFGDGVLLREHDGNRDSHKGMRVAVQMPESDGRPGPTRRISISQHVLAPNLTVLGSAVNRDKLNRELVRLSFLSAQATQHKDAQKYSRLQAQFKSEFAQFGAKRDREAHPQRERKRKRDDIDIDGNTRDHEDTQSENTDRALNGMNTNTAQTSFGTP